MGFIVIVNHYTDLMKQSLGGGFKYFLFSPLFGEDFQFDWYFSDGLKPPTSNWLVRAHLVGSIPHI